MGLVIAAEAALAVLAAIGIALFPAAGAASQDPVALPVADKGGKDASGWEVPPDKAALKNPVPRDEKSIAAGKTAYAGQCADCHGSKGLGNGRMAASTTPGRPT